MHCADLKKYKADTMITLDLAKSIKSYKIINGVKFKYVNSNIVNVNQIVNNIYYITLLLVFIRNLFVFII